MLVVNADRCVLMSGDSSRHRITVLRTRREWSPLEKRRIVIEASISGANVSAVARRHGIAPPLLYRWRKELSVADPTASAAFLPVLIEQAARPLLNPKIVSPSAASLIEIILTNGRMVRVGADVDTAALVRIVAALEKAE